MDLKTAQAIVDHLDKLISSTINSAAKSDVHCEWEVATAQLCAAANLMECKLLTIASFSEEIAEHFVGLD